MDTFIHSLTGHLGSRTKAGEHGRHAHHVECAGEVPSGSGSFAGNSPQTQPSLNVISVRTRAFHGLHACSQHREDPCVKCGPATSQSVSLIFVGLPWRSSG